MHLMLSRRYLADLLSGRKRATVRLGVLKPGSEALIHSGGRIAAIAEVVEVRYKKFSELDDDDAELDGYSTAEELRRALKAHYPHIREDSTVTILVFGSVRPIDLPEGGGYRGLRPAELARRALRRSSLNEEERRILEAVAEYKSIRRAAAALFGTFEARRKIRRVLRKAAEMLGAEERWEIR